MDLFDITFTIQTFTSENWNVFLETLERQMFAVVVAA